MRHRRPSKYVFWADWAVLISGRGLTAIGSALVFAVGARHVDKSDFGTISSLIGVGAVLTIAVDGASSQLAIRHGGLSVREWRLGRPTIAVRSTALIVGGVLFVYDLIRPMGIPRSVSLDLAFLLVYSSVSSFELLSSSLLIAYSRIGLSVIVQCINRGASLLLLFVVGTVGHNWTAGLYLAVLAGPGLSVIWLGLAKRLQPSQVDENAGWRERLGFLQFSASSQLQNLETPIVNATSGGVQAAYIGLGSRLTGPLAIATNAGSTLLLRRSSSVSTKPVRYVLAIFTTIPVLVAAALPAHVLTLVVGEDYRGGVVVLRLVLVTVAVNSFVQPFAAHLQGAGESAYVGKIVMTCVLGGLAVCTVGSLFAGAAGGAAGMLFSQVIQLAVFIGNRRNRTLEAST